MPPATAAPDPEASRYYVEVSGYITRAFVQGVLDRGIDDDPVVKLFLPPMSAVSLSDGAAWALDLYEHEALHLVDALVQGILDARLAAHPGEGT